MNDSEESSHRQSRAETLKQFEPWGRLLLSTIVWVATVAFIAGRSAEQQRAMVETVESAKTQFSATAVQINLRIDNLSDQIMRLAISNERLSTQMTDQVKSQDELKHRIERMEEHK